MNPQHPLTQLANTRLLGFLTGVGNRLNIQHKMALSALNDSLTKMAEGSLQGRLAFGLPTGTGKTRAIIEWCTAMISQKLPYSVAVSSSRIDALITMKKDMEDAGIPEYCIGLLHEAGTTKAVKSNTDSENQDRQILLMSHQMIRSSESNLKRYNTYHGQPRNLLIYDESLLTTDVNHFGIRPLCGAIANMLELIKRQEEHATISNYLTEVKQLLEAAEEGFFDGISKKMLYQPYLDPNTAAFYTREWKKHGMISHFLQAANLPLRVLQAGTSAVVSYQVVMPEALKNVLVLDASFPIRKLCHFDETIQDAQTVLGLKRQGVDFAKIKKFDHVELFRLKSYGGRNSMEKRFKDRQMAKEVVAVIKTIPEDESILCYVYKLNQLGGCDYSKILLRELELAGIDLKRVTVETYGNETSLNSYAHCQHVFLVGILHRAETELMGQYLAQTRNLEGELSRELVDDISLSERAHIAYQALSRGSSRFVDNGQAKPMKGYIVEIDPEIETSLSTVMPGVSWSAWKPMFLPETDSLMEKVQGQIEAFLMTFDGNKISSRKLKELMGLCTVAPRTWAAVIKRCTAPKNNMEECTFPWKLVGSSLVRISGEYYGFKAESIQ